MTIAGIFALSSLIRPSGCRAAVVSAGERIRFVTEGGLAREATVISVLDDTIASVVTANAQLDTLDLRSLKSLEVFRPGISVPKGFVGGVILGALAAILVTAGSYALEEPYAPDWIAAPVGAAIGGVGGVSFALIQGTRWEHVDLQEDE